MQNNIYEQTLTISPDSFAKKPLLKKIYKEFYSLLAQYLSDDENGLIVELGAGPENIKEVIPDCLLTGLSPQPWLDQVENAYQLSFSPGTVSDLILLDVFHHLQYPGTALEEFYRVLSHSGRVIIFEPCMSLLGLLVYGLFHHEPLALSKAIKWRAPSGWSSDNIGYYAAQGNAYRVFYQQRNRALLDNWKIVACKRITAISYAASGGYTQSQLYPGFLWPLMRQIDRCAQLLPGLFATRMLVVLEKVRGKG